MFFFAYDDFTVHCVDTDDIEWLRPGEAKTATLTDRITVGSLVLPQRFAADMNDIAVHGTGAALFF